MKKFSPLSLFVIVGMLMGMLMLGACASPATPTEEPVVEEATEAAEPVVEEEVVEEVVAPSGEFDLIWWGSQNRHDRTIATVDLFMESHPDITVNYEFVGWSDYWTTLATKSAGGNLPDVIQQDYARFFQFAEDGLIVELDPYIESGLIDVSNVPDAALAGGRINGQLYALSLGTNSQSFVIDLDMFEEAGVDVPADDWTWADFEETVMAIHDAIGKYGMDGDLFNPQLANALYLSLGEGLYNDDGTALGFTDTQPLIDYFSMAVRLQDAGAIRDRAEFTANPPTVENNAFVTSDAAMYFAHTNQFVALHSAAGEDRNLMMVPVPRAVGATQSANYLKPSMFFSLSSQGENPDAGALFIDYFTNSVDANMILAAERGVPVSTAVADAIKPSMDPVAAATFDFLANLDVSPIRPPDPVAHGDLMNNIFLPLVVEPLLFNQLSPEDAVALFVEEANALLAEQ